jgi:hypothetical protein
MNTCGFCQCGCGEETRVISASCSTRGLVKGEHRRFVHGHNCDPSALAPYQNCGDRHNGWKGGRIKTTLGYIYIYKPNHPSSTLDGYVLEHILLAEKAIGHSLSDKNQIHHANNIPDDNRNSNIVICQDDAYHKLLHQRQRAHNACGHAFWLKCWICKQYDDPKKLYVNGKHRFHRSCSNAYQIKRYYQKKGDRT